MSNVYDTAVENFVTSAQVLGSVLSQITDQMALDGQPREEAVAHSVRILDQGIAAFAQVAEKAFCDESRVVQSLDGVMALIAARSGSDAG